MDRMKMKTIRVRFASALRKNIFCAFTLCRIASFCSCIDTGLLQLGAIGGSGAAIQTKYDALVQRMHQQRQTDGDFESARRLRGSGT
jgi:hypothetical protein